MIDTIIWNIRGVKSRGAFERLKFLTKLNKLQIISILEPFVDKDFITLYKRWIGMNGCCSNINGKIWIFWTSLFEASEISNDTQQVTMKFKQKDNFDVFYMTFVYAKDKEHLRKPLWESLHNSYNLVGGPWCISGDFNVIMDANEKKGGNPHKMQKSWDFINSMEECGMVDAGFSGPRFTWCNARDMGHRIWKRLDRVFINQEWTAKYPRTSVEHLASTGSDHTPMLVRCSNTDFQGMRYFKFLNFWTDQPQFKEIVQNSWQEDIQGNIMWKFQQKLKLLGKNLSKWSREQIGDIQKHVKEWESKMQLLEDKYIDDNRDEAREEMHKAQAIYSKWLKCEDSLLRQKASIRWLDEGDSNTKYFHSMINDRTRRLTLHKIKNQEGQWISGDKDIGDEAVKHFENLFGEDRDPQLHHLDCIHQEVTDKDNDALTTDPREEEIKKVVFDLNPNSAHSPDGFNGYFY
ncbi:uncharacterized protein LOC132053826 [Lycium ferocissimum]|uniref:uncharacterized protein LOC132053826 n=1 Tax=Lycium ferocissimum TaxID=112874 RepID=UPI00281630C7|nr:uncharacterized protein LOC132053826 [Lycium ferocissimum]